MSKGVSKQCSILNYLRQNDEDLHELIQNLCLGKIFIPRRDSHGITFLRPDKGLTKTLMSMASSDPEKAVEVIQSLVLTVNLKSLKDFEKYKDNIPTFLRYKLKVSDVDSKKVTLANGAVITEDKDFHARNDRDNISVHIISGQLVPTDGDVAEPVKPEPKSVKGGANLEVPRRELFELIVRSFCKHSTDSAMEFLVALHTWANEKGDKDLVEVIKSLVSYDTLATLACLMQPYRSSAYYIPDTVLAQACKDIMGYSGAAFVESIHFTANPDCVKVYDELATCSDWNDLASSMQNKLMEKSETMVKVTAVDTIKKLYHMSLEGLPDMRKRAPKSMLFAEAELRVMSAVIQENDAGCLDCDTLLSLFQNCSLDEPWMCSEKDLLNRANIGFYYSTVYLIARSDAFMHLPSYKGDTLEHLTNDDKFISLNATFKALNNARREKSKELLNKPSKY